MEVTKYSRTRLLKSLNHWHVPRDFAEPMFNYLVYGLEPGGFFTGWYANDASSIVRSHPANTVEALKALMKWMMNVMPRQAWGSHEKVSAWIKMEPAQRRKILEDFDLFYSEEEEIMLTLRNSYVEERIFWD